MVEVATELLGSTPIAAVDMPLSVSPSDILECVAEKMKQVDEGEGVLMLVDMGSLAMLESRLEEKTGISIKTISNVTTSMVLDAVRKVNYLNLNLHAIYQSVTKDFIELWERQPAASGKKKALVSICTTGAGTAKKLEDILTTIVNKASDTPIHILTVSSIKLANSIKEIEKEYEILATVGTKDPKINAPHVSLEVLIEGEGEKLIQQAITKGSISLSNGLNEANIIVRELCEDSLKKYLVFLNPHHVIDMLLEWPQTVQDELGVIFNNAVLIKVIMHTAFAFERVIKQNPIAFSEEEEINDQLKEMVYVTERTLAPYEEKLGLRISDDEKLFIAAIFAEEVHGQLF